MAPVCAGNDDGPQAQPHAALGGAAQAAHRIVPLLEAWQRGRLQGPRQGSVVDVSKRLGLWAGRLLHLHIFCSVMNLCVSPFRVASTCCWRRFASIK